MVAGESAREDGIDAVAIVTPNHMHFDIAKAFLEAGFHVICDKPLTINSGQANELIQVAEKSQRILAVTYNYTGYPMVRHARALVERGDLGNIRVVQAEYAQDWLAEAIEQTGHKQAAWRTDPEKSGAGGCIGDIGTHAYHLSGFITGLKTKALCADLSTFVDGRRTDDNASLLLRFTNGAKGILWASQVAIGNENNLSLRVFGDKGGLAWRQEDPNELIFTPLGEAPRRITRGSSEVTDASSRVTRIPAGNPEGYLEGFATIYSEVAAAIRAKRECKPVDDKVMFPTGEDGLKGVVFVEAVVRSSEMGSVWVDL
jgi:predicted dehydrogenase